MYDRYIEVKNGLVFVDRINYLIMDCTMFPKDITYYVEIGEDW